MSDEFTLLIEKIHFPMNIDKAAPVFAAANTYASLAILSFVAAVTGWEDIKTKKIRNKWILVALAGGFIVHAASMIFYLAFFRYSNVEMNFSYLGNTLLNTTVAALVSFLLWKIGIWPAGDGKLFIAFSFLLPLEFYSKGYTDYFPSSALLINIFFVAFVIIVAHTIVILFSKHLPSLSLSSLFDTKARKPISRVLITRIKENWAANVLIFVFFLLVFLALSASRKKLASHGLSSLMNIATLLLMLTVFKSFSNATRSLLKKHARLALPAVATSMIIVWALIQFHFVSLSQIIQSAKTIAFYMVGISAAFKLMDALLDKTEVEHRALHDLRATDVLTEKSLKHIQSGPDGLNIGSVVTDGLTSEQLKEIMDSSSGPRIFETYKTLPFAPMAALGVLLTCLLRASVIHHFLMRPHMF